MLSSLKIRTLHRLCVSLCLFRSHSLKQWNKLWRICCASMLGNCIVISRNTINCLKLLSFHHLTSDSLYSMVHVRCFFDDNANVCQSTNNKYKFASTLAHLCGYGYSWDRVVWPQWECTILIGWYHLQTLKETKSLLRALITQFNYKLNNSKSILMPTDLHETSGEWLTPGMIACATPKKHRKNCLAVHPSNFVFIICNIVYSFILNAHLRSFSFKSCHWSRFHFSLELNELLYSIHELFPHFSHIINYF